MTTTDLTIQRGDSEQIDFTISGVADPFDDVAFTMRERWDGPPIVQKALGDGITVDGSVVTVTIAPVDTNWLPKRLGFFYDLQVTAGGRDRTVDSGRIVVIPDVAP